MKRPLITPNNVPHINKKSIYHQVGYGEFVQQLLEAAEDRPFVQLSQSTMKIRENNPQHQSLDPIEHLSEQHPAKTLRMHSMTHIDMKDSGSPSESRREAVDKSLDNVESTTEDAAGHIHQACPAPKARLPSLAAAQGQKKNNTMSEIIREVGQTPSPDATKEKRELPAAAGNKQIAAGSLSVVAQTQVESESKGGYNIAGQKVRRDTIQETPSPIVTQEKERTLIGAQAEDPSTTKPFVAALIRSPHEFREKERAAGHMTTRQSGDDDQTMAESASEGAGGGTYEDAEPKVKPDSLPEASRGASPKTSTPKTATKTSPDAALQRAASKRSASGEVVLQKKVLDERTSEGTPTKYKPRKKRQFAQAIGIFKTPTQGYLVSSDIDSSDAEDGHDVNFSVSPLEYVKQLPLQPTPEQRRKRRGKDQNEVKEAVVYIMPRYSERTMAGKGMAATGDVESSRLLEHKSINTIRKEAEATRSESVSRADIMTSAESAVEHYARPWSTSMRKRRAKDVIAESTRRSKRRKQDGGEGEVNLVGTGRIVVAVLIDDKVDLSGYKRADRQGQGNDGAF